MGVIPALERSVGNGLGPVEVLALGGATGADLHDTTAKAIKKQRNKFIAADFTFIPVMVKGLMPVSYLSQCIDIPSHIAGQASSAGLYQL